MVASYLPAQSIATELTGLGPFISGDPGYADIGGYETVDLGGFIPHHPAAGGYGDFLDQTIQLTEDAVSPLELYPNPGNQEGFVVEGLSEDSQIRLCDLQGREFKMTTRATGAQRVNVQPSSMLSQGLYLVRIQRRGATILQKKITIE